MYRLVEENRNIESHLSKTNLFHPKPHRCPSSPVVKEAHNKSPPPRPYDELQMDQQNQQHIQDLYRPHQPAAETISSMDGSNHSTSSAKDHRLWLRMEMDISTKSFNSSKINDGSSSTGPSRQRYQCPQDSLSSVSTSTTTSATTVASAEKRMGRKSHPWQTDVKINRFSSTAGGQGRPPLTGTSRTQQSTLGWKQRMQERRAVFGNVAVPEQSFDDDDGIMAAADEDEDDESRGETIEEQIREEAVELLKSKGFHNFQGILEHQYDDDLESVGGSISKALTSPPVVADSSASSTAKHHTINLVEIQRLREKILLQQEKNDICLDSPPNHSDEEEEAFDQKAQGLLRESVLDTAVNTKETATTSARQPEDNQDALKAWRVMKQLRLRLLDVFTDDYYIIEAMGRKGVGLPDHRNIPIDENAFVRHKLRDAVEKRVSLVYTGDHHIVCSSDREVDQSFILPESLSGDTGSLDGSNKGLHPDEEELVEDEEKEGILLREDNKPSQVRECLAKSFFVFEAMMRARQQAAVGAGDGLCKVPMGDEFTIRCQADMLPGISQTQEQIDDDDQSNYSEYTIDTAGFKTGNCQRIVSTANEVDGNMFVAKGATADDSRKTIVVSNSQAFSLVSTLEECTTPRETDYDDEESFAEYTVFDDSPAKDNPPMSMVATNLFQVPGKAEMPGHMRQNEASDGQSYMDFTVDGGALQPGQSCDDESYMEFTVQGACPWKEEVSPPTRMPPKPQDPSDSESYMEVTVADPTPNPSVMMSSPDLTSPHLTSMLSSRMFADMQLPQELQQRQQCSVDGDHDFYPTIMIMPEDDELTQLTFDETMGSLGGPQGQHQQDARYLENSAKTKEVLPSLGYADITSVVGSQNTEQTRDTTVSDDGSSHQGDGASFKSCISTESSQYVAELLRRDIWSHDIAVVQMALEKLGQEATKGFHERSNIVRYGGLLAMLRAMELRPDIPQIQIAAYAALENMSMDVSTQVAIGEVGGIPAVANSMRGHPGEVSLQKAACKALACLTRHREGGSVLSQVSIPTEGVVEVVAKTMQEHPDDADIQANAFGTLANLCLDSHSRLRELKRSGGLAAMTMALQVPWSNQTDQHEAISMLSILLRSMTLLDKN